MSAGPARIMSDERGFTLVELLAVMTIAIVLLSATLLTFNNLYQATTDNDRRLDSVEVARTGLDIQARQLRNLAKRLNNTAVVDTLGPYDLIFQTSDPSRTWVRYCLDTTTAPASAKRGRVWTQALATSSASYPVTAAMRTGCPSSSDWTTTKVVADHVTNRRDNLNRALFSFTCTTGSSCTSTSATYDQVVGISALLYVDTTPATGAAELKVSSGVYLRNQNQAPVASFVATPKAGEPRTVVLNGSGSSDFEGRTLSYYWFKQALPATSSIDCANPTIAGSGPVRTLWGANGYIGGSITLSHTFPAGDGAAGSTRNIGLVVCDPGDRFGTAGVTSTIAVQIPN